MDDKTMVYVKLFETIEENKNIIVSGGVFSGKTFLVNKYLSENKDKYKKVFVCHFDREKYLLYGKSQNLTIDCILKNALLCCFSLRDGNFLSTDCCTDFEQRLCENTLLVVEDFDIASPSPYMRHLAKLPCKMIVVSRCEMNNCGDDFKSFVLAESDRMLNIAERIASLSQRQNELLITLSGMLFYLREDTEIKSSKNGVFDENSVRFYLDSLTDELDNLVERGLVNVHENGRISVDRAVSEYVITNLSPTLDNCPTFSDFCERYCDFFINTSAKDTFGIINTDKKNGTTFATRELIEVYTHFCVTDENAPTRIYNLLISYLFATVGKECENNSSEHLFLRNKDYMLELLEKELPKAKSLDFLLSDEGNMDVDLDIVRMCICCFRNMPFSLYKMNETLVSVFIRVLERLYNKISCLDDNEVDKAGLFGDVVRICYETFSFGCAVTHEAKYNGFREDFDKHRINYVSQSMSDYENAVSLYMGYSCETVKLYGVFQKFLDAYIDACKKNSDYEGVVVKNLRNQRLADARETTKSLSVHFCRIKNGYDRFYAFFDEVSGNEKIYENDLDDDFDKKLKDNRHYLVRGFDKGTKLGANKYAEEIMNTLKNVQDPFPYLRLVFDSTFPLNDEVYKSLLSCGLADFVKETKRIPNLAKQILLEYIVDVVFVGNPKQEYTKLCFACIDVLLETVNQTEAFGKRLSNIASAMYLENVFYCLEHNKTSDRVEKLYCRCNRNLPDETSDEYFAKVLYSKLCGKTIKYNKSKLLSSMKCIVYEYMTQNNDFSRKGFAKACSIVSDEKTAKIILDMLVSYDFSSKLIKDGSDEK